MSLFDALKNAKVAEEVVTVGGNGYLVIGLMSDAREELFSLGRTKKGEPNGTLGKRFLAACVCDPATREPIQPDFREWNIPSHLATPLNIAIRDVCGLDEEEAEEMAKNSVGASDSG
jgi:hypothetical protein